MEEDRGMVGNFVLQVNRNLMPFLSVSSYWGMFLGCEQVAGKYMLQASGSTRFKVAWMRILIWSSGFMIFLTLSIIMGHWTALYF